MSRILHYDIESPVSWGLGCPGWSSWDHLPCLVSKSQRCGLWEVGDSNAQDLEMRPVLAFHLSGVRRCGPSALLPGRKWQVLELDRSTRDKSQMASKAVPISCHMSHKHRSVCILSTCSICNMMQKGSILNQNRHDENGALPTILNPHVQDYEWGGGGGRGTYWY